MLKINEDLYIKLADMHGADRFGDDTGETIILGNDNSDYLVYLVQNDDEDHIFCYTFNVRRANNIDPFDPDRTEKERKCSANRKELKTYKSLLRYIERYLPQ